MVTAKPAAPPPAPIDDKVISDLMQMGMPMGKPPPGDRSAEYLDLPLGSALPKAPAGPPP